MLGWSLAVVAAVVLGLVVVVERAESDSPGPLRFRGADISFTLQEEAVGALTRGPHGPVPIEDVLAAHGANTVRLRVWVDPQAGTSDLTAALTLARRAAAAGLRIVLALHYADTWADHAVQPTPAAWTGLDLDDLVNRVRSYTESVVAAFAQQGTPVAVVQVGNEVDNGLLWPVGRLATAGWDAVARLLAAGVSGARSGGGGHRPDGMLHLTASGNPDVAVRFVGEMEARGVRPDILGLSYYPWWHGSLTALQRTLDTVAEEFDLDVLLAETARPWTLDDGDDEPNGVRSDADLPDSSLYPATPAGQAAWFEALRGVLERVPGGHGAGFLFWEPGWLPGVSAVPGIGSAYDNTTLFRWDGTPLPALTALRSDPAGSGAGGQAADRLLAGLRALLDDVVGRLRKR
jgi:arabinogalactan endo-1,4-beta-galactosidase